MPLVARPLLLVASCTLAGGFPSASAQATATATQRITPSVFLGASGVYTGLGSGRNLSLTAGVDVAFRPGSRIHPALEYRGTYALDKGHVDSLRSSLGGLKFFTSYRRLQPYLTLLAGRGETTYLNGGYEVPGNIIFYTQSSSNVFSLGGGTDLLATHHLALRLDIQAQRYSSPVTTSGHLYSQAGTIGLVYTLHRGAKPY